MDRPFYVSYPNEVNLPCFGLARKRHPEESSRGRPVTERGSWFLAVESAAGTAIYAPAEDAN